MSTRPAATLAKRSFLPRVSGLFAVLVLSQFCDAIADQIAVIPAELHPKVVEIAPDNLSFGEISRSYWCNSVTVVATLVDGPSAAQPKARIGFARKRTSGVGTEYHLPKNQWLAQRAVERISSNPGPMQEEDIIPVYQWLYRVNRLRVEADRHGVGLTLSRVERNDWPPGITLDPYAHAVAEGGSLDVPFAFPNGPPAVQSKYDPSTGKWELRVSHETRQPDLSPMRRDELIVADVGVSFTVSTMTDTIPLRVVSVVNPDSEHGIRGWVELRRIMPEIVPFGVEQ